MGLIFLRLSYPFHQVDQKEASSCVLLLLVDRHYCLLKLKRNGNDIVNSFCSSRCCGIVLSSIFPDYVTRPSHLDGDDVDDGATFASQQDLDLPLPSRGVEQ
jgi:hypothetical protein